MHDVNYQNIVTPEQAEANALAELQDKISRDLAKDRSKSDKVRERLIEIEESLSRNRGAEEFYENGRVNLAGVLKVVTLLRIADHHEVIKEAGKMGTKISDHTLLVIDNVASALRRG